MALPPLRGETLALVRRFELIPELIHREEHFRDGRGPVFAVRNSLLQGVPTLQQQRFAFGHDIGVFAAALAAGHGDVVLRFDDVKGVRVHALLPKGEGLASESL